MHLTRLLFAIAGASLLVGGELIFVPSKDGTRIGVECEGAGPTLLFVHGGGGDRSRGTPMFPLLSSKFTVCAMDRRGRGDSGDAPQYSLSREAEDVAAVVNSRIGPVIVLGHSYGGVAALEAAFLTDRITALILYEPPLHEPVGNNVAVARRVEQMVRKGDLEEALVTFQTEIVKQSPEEIARMRARPTWSRLVSSMRVHARQMFALAAYRFNADRMKSVGVPTLLLIGEGTLSRYAKRSIDALHQSLPNAAVVVLPQQEHNAMEAGREVLARSILKFAEPYAQPFEHWSPNEGSWTEYPDAPGTYGKDVIGNAKTGNWVMFVKFDPGAWANWHWHSNPQTMFVVSGTMNYEVKPHPVMKLTPGSFVVVPARALHNGTCVSQEPCTFFIENHLPNDKHMTEAPTDRLSEAPSGP